MKSAATDRYISLGLGLFAFSVIFSVTAVEAALLLVLALVLFKKRAEGSLPSLKADLYGHPLFLPWMLYLGVCLLTALTAYYPVKGLGQVNSDFLKYVCLSTLLLAVKKEHLSRLAAIYTLTAFVFALIGIAEVVRSIAVGDLTITRANAFMNAVRYSEVMTIALTLIISRLLLPVNEVFRGEQLLYKLAALPVFTAITLTQTRGSYLGLITLVAVMAWFGGAARKKMAAITAVMLVAAALLVMNNPSLKTRLSAMANPRQGDFAIGSPSTGINIRKELWKLGFTMLKAHPVVGVGPDNVKKVFTRFHPEPVGYEGIWGSLHNLYIHQAAERGLLGLGALLLLFWTMFRFALERFRKARSPYALWALCALPVYYVMNLTEISFQHVHTAFAIFLALAFSAAAVEEKLSS